MRAQITSLWNDLGWFMPTRSIDEFVEQEIQRRSRPFVDRIFRSVFTDGNVLLRIMRGLLLLARTSSGVIVGALILAFFLDTSTIKDNGVPFWCAPMMGILTGLGFMWSAIVETNKLRNKPNYQKGHPLAGCAVLSIPLNCAFCIAVVIHGLLNEMYGRETDTLLIWIPMISLLGGFSIAAAFSMPNFKQYVKAGRIARAQLQEKRLASELR